MEFALWLSILGVALGAVSFGINIGQRIGGPSDQELRAKLNEVHMHLADLLLRVNHLERNVFAHEEEEDEDWSSTSDE